ncbi:MAG: 1-deoxy-D-xylulose-5-phosphate reductoisomerase [Planctomycetota bacterium]
MRKIAILGSTGSIGQQTLDVIRDHPQRFQVVGLAAHQNGEKLAEQAREFQPACLCLSGQKESPQLSAPQVTRQLAGTDGLVELVESCGCDLVMNAITGAAGLTANFRTLQLGIDLAIANKESLVMAGEILLPVAAASGASVTPVDSEHSAVAQCLRAGRLEEVERIYLTASGGPFRGRSRDQLTQVTVEEALKHPTWKMGPKISIDSATLMNKALEILEARVLFALEPQRIGVLIHPQSVVHSIVEFRDGSFMAHLGAADMRIPIQYALSQGERWPRPESEFSLVDSHALEFQTPDHETFPSIRMAYQVAQEGGTTPVVFNAANEVAVEKFLAGEIPFLSIFELVSRALDGHDTEQVKDIAQILNVDRQTRQIMKSWS